MRICFHNTLGDSKMMKLSERIQEAERLGLLNQAGNSVVYGYQPSEVIESSELVLTGYGKFTPITVRSSSIPLDADLE